MDNVGMVAVVQGLRDSGLAVTFLDGRRPYNLVPQAGRVELASPSHQYHSNPNPSIQKQSNTTGADTTRDSTMCCDSCTQATDGRYASVYQMSHCNVMPTSPPVQLSEFPPQRAELCPGHGNFEVGGSGSGETRCSPTRTPGCYHRTVPRPDRGAACSPRTSEPDAFVDSLRKYPMMERSSEIVERFINYAQSKNFARTSSRYVSPVRSAGNSDTSYQTVLERNSSRNTGGLVPKTRAEASPTRDTRARNENPYYRSTFCKNPDVRHVMDARRVPENVTSMSRNINSVNTDTQASVQMVSRQTGPPSSADSKKNVAISHSPCTSNNFRRSEDVVSQQLYHTSPMTENKSINLKVQAIQTTSSSIDLLTSAHSCDCTAAKSVRKYKSEEKLKEEQIQDRMLEEHCNITINTKNIPKTSTKEEILKDMCMNLQRLSESFDRNSNKEKFVFNFSKKLREMPVWIPINYDLKAINELTGDTLIKTKKLNKEPEVFRAELSPLTRIHNEQDNIENVIKLWVNGIPIKHHDFIGRPVERLHVTDTLIRKLLRLFLHKSRYYDIAMLKRKIIRIITEAPLDMSAYKRRYLMFRLVDILIDKIKDVSPHVLKKSNSLEVITNRYNHKTGFVYTSNKLSKPSEEELTELLWKELESFKKQYHLSISSKLTTEIISELMDILIESTDDIRFENSNSVNEDIVMFLRDTGLFSLQQANYFAKHLLEKLKTIDGQTKNKWNNRDFVVLENTLTKSGPYVTLSESSRIEKITQSDVNRNLEAYANELYYQIDDWLTKLSVKISEVNEKDFRQDVINDLVGDIVDRHRYLEITKGHKGNESEELEYLKYQIFKWIKKLAGEEQKETMSHAPDLMKRIRNIPVPMSTITYQNTNTSPEQNNQLQNFNSSVCSSSKTISQAPVLNLSNQICQRDSLGSLQIRSPSRRSIKDLNEEYDEFVKNWVQKIPIPVTNYIDPETVEKARMGIYNGIWKAVTKLKFCPEVFHNQFYYQDMLDDEIEKLLDSLPKTDELDSKKQLLKVQLIAKTVDINEMIKNTAESASFKQQLIQVIFNNIARQTITNNPDDPMKLNEELQVLNIVENYILNAGFKEEDKVKADVYRKKLLSNIKGFVDQLKKNDGQSHLDPELYMTDILNALHKVPLPSEETIKEERDQILLGIEIEQWLSELPIIPNDDHIEQLQRRRLRDALAEKIFEMQKNNNISEGTLDSAVKHEVSRFLGKIPLQQNESLNINFMVDELINRLKNRTSEYRKKSVTFQEPPLCYDQFGRDLIYCSSFNDESGRMAYQASPQYLSSFQADSGPIVYQSSPEFRQHTSEHEQYHPIFTQETGYAPSIIVGGGLANISGAMPSISDSLSQGYVTFDQNRPISSSLHDGEPYNWRYVNQIPSGNNNQSEPVWLTLEETKSPNYGQAHSIQIQQHQSRQQYQSPQQYQTPHQYQSPQQYHNMYVGGTNGRLNHTNNRQAHDITCNMNKTQNVAGIQDYQNRALATSQIAAGHAVNQFSDKSGFVPANTRYRNSTACPNISNISQKANIDCRQKHSSLKSVLRPDYQKVANKSSGQFFSIPVEMPSLPTTSHQRPYSSQGITNEYGAFSQVPNSMPETATGGEQAMAYQYCAHLQVPNNGENLKANTQYPSSYGQPQGFSTPHQERQDQQSPPRLGKKRDRVSNRAKTGLIRKRLEFDDSEVDEVDEEECHCMEHKWRRRRPCYEDYDYPRYMLMPFPCPYFY